MNPLRWIAKGLRDFVMPDTSKVPEGRLKVVNATRGTVIATRLEVAASGKTRRKGLLGRDGLDTGEGLWIIPCESVHTFFMRFPIDLVYLDRENRIRKVRERVGPWRLSACLSARSVLELPAGTIRATETQRGDTLELTPQPANESEAEKTL
ncbi:MAG TPA: DUF192 domain-containing protein [Terracidiphilus sp.]|jgi:hypothetical protein